MFDFRKTRAVSRRRRPVTIGFEQLEVREMCSSGVSLTIIPTETRPLLSMPRPYLGSFDPQAERPITVALKPRREVEDRVSPLGLWHLGVRFRFR
jgi:hypothetical protein